MAETLKRISNAFLNYCRRHPLQVLSLGAVVGLVVMYGASRFQKPFPHWDEPGGESVVVAPPPSEPFFGSDALDEAPSSAPSTPAASITPSTQPSTQPQDPEQVSKDLLWDPEEANVAPRYRLPVKLSTDELHQLILDMECLEDLCEAHHLLLVDHGTIGRTVTDNQVRDAIFWRIKNRRGFKEPELPFRWKEFNESGPSFSIISRLTAAYVGFRVNRIRYRIIGAQHTEGDYRFVAFATKHYCSEMQTAEAWIRRAEQLQRWLVDDGVLTRMSVASTTLDKYKSADNFIQTIRRKHEDRPIPADTPNPVARVAPGGNWHGDDTLVTMNHLQMSRYRAIQLELEASLGVELSHDYSPQVERQKPPLLRARDTYLTRKAAFRGIAAELRTLASSTDFDRSAEAIKLMDTILDTKAAHDLKQAEKFHGALTRMARRGGDKFTVAETAALEAAEAWHKDVFNQYRAQHERMERLITMLRQSKSAPVRRLAAPSTIDSVEEDSLVKYHVWLFDPFSFTPNQKKKISSKNVDPTYRDAAELPKPEEE